MRRWDFITIGISAACCHNAIGAQIFPPVPPETWTWLVLHVYMCRYDMLVRFKHAEPLKTVDKCCCWRPAFLKNTEYPEW